MNITACYFDDLPEWVDKASLPNNGSGKEYATYLVIEDGEYKAVHSDAMEPEDARFGRDLKWIVKELYRENSDSFSVRNVLLQCLATIGINNVAAADECRTMDVASVLKDELILRSAHIDSNIEAAEIIEAIEVNLWQVSYMRWQWVVQAQGQVVGNIAKGGTLREAVSNAIEAIERAGLRSETGASDGARVASTEIL